jgi:hypothetical protein
LFFGRSRQPKALRDFKKFVLQLRESLSRQGKSYYVEAVGYLGQSWRSSISGSAGDGDLNVSTLFESYIITMFVS